jgi:uncharacterized RmlC-like cupin family protein
MPDGARAKVHYHKGIETIAYLPAYLALGISRNPG